MGQQSNYPGSSDPSKPGFFERVQEYYAYDNEFKGALSDADFVRSGVGITNVKIIDLRHNNYEQLSKIGIVQVFCRADCVRLTPAGEVTHGGTGGWPVARGGKPVAGAPRL